MKTYQNIVSKTMVKRSKDKRFAGYYSAFRPVWRIELACGHTIFMRDEVAPNVRAICRECK